MIDLGRKIMVPFARFTLFIVYFWFGWLKVAGISPASDLVQNLFSQTMTFIPFSTFIVLFGLFEMLIGLLFLIRGAGHIALTLFTLHMITVFLPFFFLPEEVWAGFFVPTLEGQYIIKNLALIATALIIATQTRHDPLQLDQK